MRPLSRLLTATVLVATMSACGGPPSKSGGKIAVTTLLATAAGASGSPGTDVLERIAKDVRSRSNGAVTISVDGVDAEDEPADLDGPALAKVRDGVADLAVVRAPAFTAAGSTAFQALQAPFLIDNEDLAQRVADDPIAGEMLARLGDIGVVGLAVVPGGLRHPVGWNAPLVTLADYRGAVINTRPSPDIDKLFDALGATTDHSIGQQRLTAAASGELRGLEMSYLAHANSGAPATMTVNVVLYSKFDVVIVNKKVFDGLSSAQRDVLRAAVAAAVPEAVAARPSEAKAAQDWCAELAQASVRAPDADVAELQHTAAQVTDELEHDPFNKRVIERIRALAIGTTPADLPACAGVTPPTTSVAAAGDQSVINGIWRFDVERSALLDAGVSPSEVGKDVGVHTFVFKDGILRGGLAGENCFGTYAIDGTTISWAFDPSSCGGVFEATFERDGDRMTFTLLGSGPEVPFFTAFFRGGLVRIGDAP